MHRPSILDKAKRVSVTFLKITKKNDGDDYFHILASCRGDTGPKRVELKVYGNNLGEASQAWVRCDCEYFMYHTEYVLDKKDNTDIKYAINRAPRITNASKIVHVCKHIAACFYRGAADGKFLAKWKKK